MERFRSLTGRSDDAGFTLLEVVVALTLATVIFTSLAAATISGVKSVLVGRTSQQATDVAERALEQIRADGYDAAAMVPLDLGVNEDLDIAGCSCYNPQDDSVSGATEALALDPAGSVAQHVTTVPINSTDYELRQYVTTPVDAAGAVYKRLTVVVTWTVRGVERKQTLTSVMTSKRSGLPLPDFKWAPQGEVADCVTPGVDQIFGFTLTNNGARDSWKVTSAGGPLVWTLHEDDPVNGTPGAFDSAEDDEVTDGVFGPIDPNRQVIVWAVAKPEPGDSGTHTITFTATSEAQPIYNQSLEVTLQIADECTVVPTPTASATVSATPTPTPTVTEVPPAQPVTCTGTLPTASSSGSVTPTSYYLANTLNNIGSTTASNPLPVTKLIPPTSTTLWNYSTDVASGTAGRVLTTTGSSTSTSVEWRRGFSAESQFIGTGVVSLWVGKVTSVAPTITITARQLSSTGTLKKDITTTVSAIVWDCGGLKRIGASMDFGNGQGTKFAATDQLSVTVTTSGADAVLGYDTTAMPAQVVLPVKNGG
jgi:prepilin-type N-terminal cleavage/methylation domain-containing protein